ncbi:tail fiber domain-containing protein (plasmid) [Klebsiella pneumoniae]|nr:tail fiber domain-containing protein [Klebsiella pneumoniae]
MRLKTDFTQASENASERIERLGVCEYRMKGNAPEAWFYRSAG